MKIKKKKRLLVIFGVVLALLLAGVGGALLWQKWTPAQIGNRYHLEDLEPGQAVLAIEALSDSFLIVDNQGRWKYVEPVEEWDDEVREWFRRYQYYPRIELYDLLLANDALPYGKGRVSRRLLTWAVNIESVELKRIPKKDKRPKDVACYIDYTAIHTCWAIAGVGENRKEVLLHEEEWSPYATKVISWSDDIRVSWMCDKLKILRKETLKRYSIEREGKERLGEEH